MPLAERHPRRNKSGHAACTSDLGHLRSAPAPAELIKTQGMLSQAHVSSLAPRQLTQQHGGTSSNIHLTLSTPTHTSSIRCVAIYVLDISDLTPKVHTSILLEYTFQYAS